MRYTCMTFRMIAQFWNTNTSAFVSCDADLTENYMYISMKFGTGVHVFCWEVGVFNRSFFQSVSYKWTYNPNFITVIPSYSKILKLECKAQKIVYIVTGKVINKLMFSHIQDKVEGLITIERTSTSSSNVPSDFFYLDEFHCNLLKF